WAPAATTRRPSSPSSSSASGPSVLHPHLRTRYSRVARHFSHFRRHTQHDTHPCRGKRIRSVACGEQHSMAVGETGDVYVWGRAKEGQLGNGERKAANALKPVRVEGLRHERVVAGVCGYNHCLAVTVGGKLYQWGMLH